MSDPTPTITTREKALAALVVPHTRSLHIDSWQCPAPVGERRCHRPKTQGLLCDQHHALAQKRLHTMTSGRKASPTPEAVENFLVQAYTLWAIERQNHKLGARHL